MLDEAHVVRVHFSTVTTSVISTDTVISHYKITNYTLHITNSEMTVSDEMTLFVTVEKWTLNTERYNRDKNFYVLANFISILQLWHIEK